VCAVVNVAHTAIGFPSGPLADRIGMKKKIQKSEDERNILPRNEKFSELTEGKRHCPKCNSVNLLIVRKKGIPPSQSQKKLTI